MAVFEINVPIETTEATILVEVPADGSLRVGRHRFQLVVVDDADNPSQPDTVTILVRDTAAPTAVLTAPESVSLNAPFTLSGQDSSDVDGGRIARYIWTYLGPAPTVIDPGRIDIRPTPVGPIGPITPEPR
jgi:hypothetical protein